ncbi:calcium-binding protein [Parachitinimonas caeni]|uniref:Calcium-binding protein n=1 Tax=Parachitinimonas caeni TaxID=3031301 RepID=A0ABT7E0H9_9NEIS|nr:calcium-binding protein [Parachitinimonas caeni]MDK2125823.1 calcium-binding protein [Parachitinimonas caeni]
MVLNAGYMPDGITKSQSVVYDMIKKAPEAGSYVTISRKFVDVSEFIQSDDFVLALENAVRADPKVPPNKVKETIDAIMNGSKDAKGVRHPDGIWDDASRRFVLESGTEHVRVMVGGAAPDSVFALSELQALLENPKIKTIDGIDKKELLSLYKYVGNAGGDAGALFRFLRAHSQLQYQLTKVGVGNIRDYLRYEASSGFLQKVDDLARSKLFSELNTLSAADYELLMKEAERLRVDYRAALQTKAPSLLGKSKLLLVVAALTGLSACSEVKAALSIDDFEKRKEKLYEWMIGFAGDFAAFEVGQALSLAATAGAVATGVVAAPEAAALAFIGGMLGGYFGGEGAVEFYRQLRDGKLLRDNDSNYQIDLLDRLESLMFGGNATLKSTPVPDLNGGKFTLSAGLTREEIVARAKTDIAWRYALRELNAFAVTDIGYDKYNTDGSLDLYDPATGRGEMTERYLLDRAAMLTWKREFERRGIYHNRTLKTDAVVGNWDFTDRHTTHNGGAALTLQIDGKGLSLTDHQVIFGNASDEGIRGGSESDRLYGGGGNDTLHGDGGTDNIEGGAGNDQLYGGDARDTLFGGSGNDMLDGGKDNDALYGAGGDDNLDGGSGNDWLEGGAGQDSYRIAAGEGNDVIVDSDGQGMVTFAGNTLLGGEVKTSAGLYESASQPGVRYLWTPDSSGVGDLLVTDTKTQQTLIIQNFKSGDLSITLGGQPKPTDTQGPGTNNFFFGGRPTGNPEMPVEGDIHAGAGNDVVLSSRHNPNIYAGDGNDYVFVGWGVKKVEGGDGNDFIDTEFRQEPALPYVADAGINQWERHYADWKMTSTVTAHLEKKTVYGGYEGYLDFSWSQGGKEVKTIRQVRLANDYLSCMADEATGSQHVAGSVDASELKRSHNLSPAAAPLTISPPVCPSL